MKGKEQMNNDTCFNLSPWNILNDMINYDRPFNSLFRTMANRAEGRFPPVNAFVGDKAVVLDIELPEKKASDVDVSLEPQAIVIEGKATYVNTQDAFKRRFELDFTINTEKATATFKNGILRIELPKAEQTALKRIEIGTTD